MPGRPETFAKVALPVPGKEPFDYLVPSGMTVGVGHRVIVPLGRRYLRGIVVALGTEPGHRGRLAEIAEDEGLAIPYWEIPYLQELGKRYRVSLGIALERTVPPRTKPRRQRLVLNIPVVQAERILQELRRRAPAQARALSVALAGPLTEGALRSQARVSRTSIQALLRKGYLRPEALPFSFGLREVLRVHTPTSEQEKAVEEIAAGMGEGRVFLLWGPPASGKTEVYLRAAARTLEAGRDVLLLEPEVSLLPQLWARARNALEEEIRLYFGELPPGDRWRAWEEALAGKVRVGVGTRSAVFLPFGRLGLMVLDEEHEPAYKQEEMAPHYHAREVAELRSRGEEAAVVLGSATPAVETFFRAERGEITLLRLSRRVAGEPPVVRAVPHRGRVIGPELREAMERHLGAGGQVLLFVNRLGFFTGAACASCGEILRCPVCEVPLVYHLREKTYRCHACGRAFPEPVCPRCGGSEFRRFGIGSERVEHVARTLFPRARIARLDSETAHLREEILSGLAAGDIDILVGTQMVGKGLDFPGITLVGVVNADQLLSMPDFRAGERTFQLIAAAAGRAGRGERPGEVIVQTDNPDYYPIRYALAGDYTGFYAQEIAFRRELGYPPFARLVRFLFRGKRAEERSGKLAQELSRRGFEVLGPARLLPLRGIPRWQVILRLREKEPYPSGIQDILEGLPTGTSVDPDPMWIG